MWGRIANFKLRMFCVKASNIMIKFWIWSFVSLFNSITSLVGGGGSVFLDALNCWVYLASVVDDRNVSMEHKWNDTKVFKHSSGGSLSTTTSTWASQGSNSAPAVRGWRIAAGSVACLRVCESWRKKSLVQGRLGCDTVVWLTVYQTTRRNIP